MDSTHFNKACSNLKPNEQIIVNLLNGQTIKGYFLTYSKASDFDGSLELETNRGMIRLLSSSLIALETNSNLFA